jgi:hypothetical protein
MFGTLILGGIGIWLAISTWVAWRAARLVKPIWLKALVIVALGPLLFFAPVGDELIGKRQFERYCKEAEEVKIYGTIPVGEAFYTADGKWKLANGLLPLDEFNRIVAIKNSIIRWDLGPSIRTEVPAAIPIQYWDSKIYEVKTGRLLAEFRMHATRGGLISRIFFERAGFFFVKPQCSPRLRREGYIEQAILPFNGNVGGGK